jgi:hypothetical protein
MLFFIDESGIDRSTSPYEVLAAVSIREDKLWEFIKAEHQLEENYFGSRLSNHRAELKGSKLLSKKRFRFAQQQVQLAEGEQIGLARSLLSKGFLSVETGRPSQPSAKELTAFGRSSIQFVDGLLDVAAAFDIKVFAAMVEPTAPRPITKSMLRKDYVYLFERIYYSLEDLGGSDQGLIVFDELEKAMARLLIDQVGNYFTKSSKGKERSKRIVPEPFFVHSDLTTLIQLADIVAYIVNWGFRAGTKMTRSIRTELVPYAQKIAGMQYRRLRTDASGNQHMTFGIICLDDLRGADDRATVQ